MDPQQLNQKEKQVMYTQALIEIYNWRYKRLVHETHGIVELEKYSISKAKNLLNLGSQQFYKISEVLQSAHVVSRNTKNNTFYLNNYINWDQFNQLYKPEWQTKGTQSGKAIIQKLMPMSRKIMEQR